MKEKMSSNSNRYELLFQRTSNMVLFFDENGAVTGWNPMATALLGYQTSDNIGMDKLFPSVFGTEGNSFFLKDELILEKEETETIVYCKNQTCFPVRLRVAYVDGKTGSFGLCIARDIREERAASRTLQQVRDEMNDVMLERNQFMANVTHELRTPVNGIMGLLQNLTQTELSMEQKESLSIIRQCCENMNNMINNILDFSKLQAGGMELEKRTFHFHAMIDKIMKMNTPQAQHKGIRLRCNIAEDIPDEVVGDELRLSQVINNLLSNAIKFTQIGQVTLNIVRTQTSDSRMEVFFVVMDTGIGIAPEDKDKLFRSFTQVDASISRRFGGSGLGLSIVKELVTMMGGQINVESELGKGSTFSFSVQLYLPGQFDEEQPVFQNKNLQDRIAAQQQNQRENYLEHRDAVGKGEAYQLGTEQNQKELVNNLERLILCIEMEKWNHADEFVENIKNLTAADRPLKRKAFRLQMTMRAEDYSKAVQEYEILQEALKPYLPSNWKML